MSENLLQQGLDLMLFGMLTVVVFLGLLVVVVSAMSRLLQRLLPATAVTPSAASPASHPIESAAIPPAVVAAIAIALAEHRRRAGPDAGGAQ